MLCSHSKTIRVIDPRKAPNSSHRQCANRPPSKSLHVTSVLSSMIISCSSRPIPACLSEPVVVSSPFSASGTSSIPFLAKIVLKWVGAQNAPLEVDHWVEVGTEKLIVASVYVITKKHSSVGRW